LNHRWLLVSADFTPLGGMDCANHGLASYLGRRPGTEVHLVTHRAWPDLEALRPVKVHWIPRPLGRNAMGEVFLRKAGQHAAGKIAKRGGRVVVNGGNCIWGDINWVHYVHAAWMPLPVWGLARRMKIAAYHRGALAAEGQSLWRARAIVANSEKTRRDLIETLKLPPERIRTVYYGTDPVRFRPPTPDERADARYRLKWYDNRPTVLFVGALGDRRKGLDTLLAAWRILCADKNWDARLAVVGKGASRGKLKRMYRDLKSSVVFLGFRRDVPDILHACDALVSPTRYEAYGLNVHEAICCGLPAMVSASAGVAERYPKSLEDLLIPDPEDVNDIAERIRAWRNDRTRFKSAIAPFTEALRSYTWDDMAERFIAAVDGSS
jgi:glycosyltransferase involved in cell wall biosynthesis